jgi:mxaD protein
MKRTLLLTLGLCVTAGSASAHGPTPQKVVGEIDIKAPPKAVWAIAGDFGHLAAWDDDLKASDGNNQSRTLTFKNGETLKEDVDEYAPDRMTYSYRMSDPNLKALPASSYSSTFTLTALPDGGTHVEWIARVYRGDTGNEPPDELSDAAAKEALGKLFDEGVKGLKAKSEAKS